MRIKEVQIKSFRGIPEELKVSFPFKNNKYCSLIILGDNGTGKSSIVDALEFCLQGQIAQDADLGDKDKPSIISLSKLRTTPSVKIVFDNKEEFQRKIIKDEDGYLTNHRKPSKYFFISPFVLRRHDIMKFIDTPDSEKTLVFSNYFRNQDDLNWIDTPKDELKKLQNQRLDSKDKRDRLLSELADSLSIPIENIPLDIKDFKRFVKQDIYKGFNKSDIEKSSFKVKLNEKAIELAELASIEMQNTRNIKNQIREYSINNKLKIFPKHLLPQLNDFLKEVGGKLTASFLSISPLDFIEKISVVYEERNVLALKINILLKNGKSCTPQQILSEANLDLLALLFYISFIQESSERGQSKFLVLDDVLQSIDSTIRVNFISYLLRNFKDWQYLFTVHDRLWHRQLTDLMNRYGHAYSNIEITEWSFLGGPKVNKRNMGVDSLLIESIDNGQLIPICSQAGLLLEEICHFLSINLSTSIHRKKDDKYTIGDLWPGISKVLKKTPIKDEVEEVDKWLHLRNVIGAHYNEWANNLSLEEAKSFGKSVLSLLDKIQCADCREFIIKMPGLDFFTCKCGKIQTGKCI